MNRKKFFKIFLIIFRNEPNESGFMKSCISSISNGKDKLSLFNKTQLNQNQIYSNCNYKTNQINQNQIQQANDNLLNNNSNSKSNNSNSSNSQNNNHNKKKRKSNLKKNKKISNFINNKNSNFVCQSSNYDNINNKGTNYSGPSSVNSNLSMGVPYNGIYEANFIHNSNLNLLNYNTLLSNNSNLMQSQINHGYSASQNQIYLNPYNIHQNMIGQQIPLTLNIPSHQAIPGSIPVNIQTNGSYLYNCIPGVNNNVINQQYQKSNSNNANFNMYQTQNGIIYNIYI